MQTMHRRRVLTLLGSGMGAPFLRPTPAMAQAPWIEYPVFYSKFSRKHVAIANAQGGRLKGLMKEVRRNGLVLWVAEPKKGRPTVMYLHGSTGGLAKRAWKFQWLIKQGFGVVAMSYPGSSGSKGVASTASILKAAHRTYRAIPDLVGPTKTVLMGESFGTGVAIRLAYQLAKKGTPPAGIALQAPYASGYALVNHQAPAIAPLFRGKNDPWPSDRYIPKLNVPIFIMHGARDTAVPIAQGRRLFTLSPSPDKLLVTRPDANHSTIWTQKGVRSALAKWLRARG